MRFMTGVTERMKSHVGLFVFELLTAVVRGQNYYYNEPRQSQPPAMWNILARKPISLRPSGSVCDDQFDSPAFCVPDVYGETRAPGTNCLPRSCLAQNSNISVISDDNLATVFITQNLNTSLEITADLVGSYTVRKRPGKIWFFGFVPFYHSIAIDSNKSLSSGVLHPNSFQRESSNIHSDTKIRGKVDRCARVDQLADFRGRLLWYFWPESGNAAPDSRTARNRLQSFTLVSSRKFLRCFVTTAYFVYYFLSWSTGVSHVWLT